MLILICSSSSFRSVHLAHLDLLIWSTWFVVHPDLVHFDLIIWFTSICSSDSLYTVIYVKNNLTVCIQLYMFRTIWQSVYSYICSEQSDSLYTVTYVQNNLTVCIQLYMFRTIWQSVYSCICSEQSGTRASWCSPPPTRPACQHEVKLSELSRIWSPEHLESIVEHFSAAQAETQRERKRELVLVEMERQSKKMIFVKSLSFVKAKMRRYF